MISRGNRNDFTFGKFILAGIARTAIASGSGFVSVPRYSSRIFVVDAEDRLYRLAGARFSDMLKRPEAAPLRRFAGQRIRFAEAIVERQQRSPVAIARLVFFTLGFDEKGILDSARHRDQMHALAERALALPSPARPGSAIVDARDRFLAAGAKWRPAPRLVRLIRDAALEKSACPRL